MMPATNRLRLLIALVCCCGLLAAATGYSLNAAYMHAACGKTAMVGRRLVPVTVGPGEVKSPVRVAVPLVTLAILPVEWIAQTPVHADARRIQIPRAPPVFF